MVKCSFSGKEIPPGTGIMYVKSDGKVFHFLSKKCEKNWLLRKSQKVKWTDEYRKVKRERMAAEAHAKEQESKE